MYKQTVVLKCQINTTFATLFAGQSKLKPQAKEKLYFYKIRKKIMIKIFWDNWNAPQK